jgi:hypothetical protein
MTLSDSAVGDILYTSWGYEQTNIDFYEIVARRGKSTLSLRKLRCSSEVEGWCRHKVLPLKGQFAGNQVLTRRISKHGTAKIESYAILHPWDGEPKHATSYARSRSIRTMHRHPQRHQALSAARLGASLFPAS